MGMGMQKTNKVENLWHSLTKESSLEKLETSLEDGLSHPEAQSRFVKYGANRLPEAVRQSAFIRFLLHFHNILI